MTAFPSITTVTHNFATNQDPLGSPWLANTYTGGTTTLLKSVSGVALKGPISSTGFGMQVHGTTFGPDMEMWLKVVTVTVTNGQEIFALFLRLQQDGAAGTVDGYVIYAELAAGADTWHIDSISNGAQTNRANATQNIAAGDYVGAKVEDSGGNPVITAYWCPAANDPTLVASWTQIVTYTDSSGTKVTGTGRTGLECQGVVTTFDDLRVGTIVTGGTDATVTAVVAASAGSAPVAALSAGATVTAAVADSVGSAPVAAVSAGGGVTVSAVPAVSIGSAPVAALSAGATVSAAPAVSAGTAPPANQLVSAVLNAPAVISLGSAPVASVSTSGADATISAVPAVSAGSAPVVSIATGSTVTAVVADSAGSAPAAALSAGVAVGAVPALSSGQVPRAATSPPPPSTGVSGDIAATFSEAST